VAGTYSSAQSVTISTTTTGASIRYTTDGVTTPTETVGTLYSSAITVSATTTIKAIAYKNGMSDSTVVSPSTSKQIMAAHRWPSGQENRGGGRKRPANFPGLLDLIASLRKLDHAQFLGRCRGRMGRPQDRTGGQEARPLGSAKRDRMTDDDSQPPRQSRVGAESAKVY